MMLLIPALITKQYDYNNNQNKVTYEKYIQLNTKHYTLIYSAENSKQKIIYKIYNNELKIYLST